ncbi:MAG: SprB repeat-containing protein, partial [Flavobacteriales bacterium]
MKRPLLLGLLIAFCFSTINVEGETLYWVGGDGDWNDASNWAINSGGQGGVGVPDAATDVVFDANSFSSPYQTVHLTGTVACDDLKFLDTGHEGIALEGSGNSQLALSGDLYLIGGSEFDPGSLRFQGTERDSLRVGESLISGDFIFEGEGEWTILNDLRLGNDDTLELVKGSLKIKGSVLKAGTFLSQGNKSRSVHLGPDGYLDVQKEFRLTDTSSYEFSSDGGRVWIDPNIPLQSIEPDGLEDVTEGISRGSRASCFDPGCIDSIEIVPQDTAAKNGYDISCKDSCDGKFIGRITDSSGCSSDASFTYNWTITGSYQQTDSLVTNVCDQSFIELEIVNDSSGQTCDVSYSLDVPFTLKRDGVIITDPSCPDSCDGEIEYYPEDGVSPYYYEWDNGDTTFTADSLCTGDHPILVTDDNNCRLYDTVSINDPPAIVPNLQTTDASCFGVCDGTAKVNPSGGNGSPYYYSWSTGATTDSIGGLCAGSYSVTVYDKDSCSKTVSFTIDEPAQLQISLDSIDHLLCHEQCQGSISVTVSQGTSPYSYEWYDANTGNQISPQQDTSKPTGLCAG